MYGLDTDTKNRTSLKGRHKASCAKLRGCAGVYLIEFLVALTVSTLIAGFLIDDISQIHRFATTGEKQLMAAAIAQEVIDNARDGGYTALQGLVATSPHTLPVNSGDGSIDPAFPRPLLLDLQQLTWSSASQSGRFYATVTETVGTPNVTPAPPNTLQVTVTVKWTEDGGMSKSYQLSTLVSQYGVHG